MEKKQTWLLYLNMELKNRTVLITGGSSGIGAEFTKQLLDFGCNVIITGRDVKKLQEMQKRYSKIHFFCSDVSDLKSIIDLYHQIKQKFSLLDLLINNAGIMQTIDLQKVSTNISELTKEIEINLMGPIRMISQFLPLLSSQKASAIVNVTSGLAFVPLPSSPVYCATKAALHSFTLSLRQQLQNTNIQVFECAPPATATELLKGEMDAEDLKGISVMEVEKMVACTLKGMQKNQMEICPGQASQLRFMSRLAPQFILSQMGRSMQRLLKKKG